MIHVSSYSRSHASRDKLASNVNINIKHTQETFPGLNLPPFASLAVPIVWLNFLTVLLDAGDEKRKG
jgi:hypothetical protein